MISTRTAACILAATALLGGCADKKCEVATPVVDPAAFELVPVDEDPFEPDAGEDGPDGGGTERGRCAADATAVERLGEEETFSIVTTTCSRLTVEAPTMFELLEGEELEIRLWHFSLLQFGLSEGHLALALGGDVMWEQAVPIPSESELIVEPLVLPRALPASTLVRWHVSNHGANSWNFVGLNALRPGKCVE